MIMEDGRRLAVRPRNLARGRANVIRVQAGGSSPQLPRAELKAGSPRKHKRMGKKALAKGHASTAVVHFLRALRSATEADEERHSTLAYLAHAYNESGHHGLAKEAAICSIMSQGGDDNPEVTTTLAHDVAVLHKRLDPPYPQRNRHPRLLERTPRASPSLEMRRWRSETPALQRSTILAGWRFLLAHPLDSLQQLG